MNAIRFGLKALWRDLKAGELAVLAAALVIAASTVTAIGFLTDRISQGVARQANEVLASDLKVSSAQPIKPSVNELAQSYDLRQASTLSFPSVVFVGDESVLAQVYAVSDLYPLRGELRVSQSLGGPAVTATKSVKPGEMWLDNALMARLNAKVGDSIELGAAEFTVSSILQFRPDQTPGFSGFAPTLLMHIDDVENTQLVQQGSRVRHAKLFAGTVNAVADFKRDLEPLLTDDMRVRDQGNAGDALNNAIERASRFLALASLVSLLLAAVAVAMSARHYARRRLDTAALMKSIGASQRFVVMSAVTQLVVIGIVASIVGASLGYGAEKLLTNILADLLRDDLPAASMAPVLLGFGTVSILLCGFALPSILQLATTPPARVLRKDLLPPSIKSWVTSLIAVVALSALVYWSVRDLKLLAIVVGGTLLGAVFFLAIGRLLVAMLSKRGGSVGVAWRYGLANIARRGGDSAIQIVAFGLGLMVLLVLTLVRNDLLSGWRATLDEGAPNRFLINIQPQEREGVLDVLRDNGVDEIVFTPLVRARMVAVNGEDVNQRVYTDPSGRRLATRDANLSYSNVLPNANEMLEGQWWNAHSEERLVSLEVDAARQMAINIGDELAFDVAGENVSATVTSLREVKWDSFEPNFFMVFTPATLREYPQTFISSLHVDEEQAGALLALVRAYPSVSVIDIEAILDQVRTIIDKAALAVQVVFFFTLLSGLVVLFAAVQSTLDERRYESALLRTFGAKRNTILSGLATEFGVLGFAAGVFASLGASVVAGLAATQLFNLPYSINPWLWLIGTLAGVLVVGVSGVVAAYSAVNEPPVNTLR